MQQNEICMQIPAHCRYLSIAAGFITAAAVASGLEDEAVEAVEIAAMEAVENVIDHAGPDMADTVRIEVLVTPESLIVDVKDRGIPWPRAVLTGEVGRDMPPPEAPRGRGLAMMRALMDEVIPTQAADGTKSLRLVKKRSTAQAAGQSSS